MSTTPFRETAKKIYAEAGNYYALAGGSRGARSPAWWQNLVEYGAWSGSGSRVGPPGRETFSGIAELFGTTEAQVAAMIAADWYGVHPDVEISARVLRMSPHLDQLQESDAELLERLARRLAATQPTQQSDEEG